jgi:putative transposase
MPRTARIAPGGMIFHVLNRGVGRREIFKKDEDYAAFERVMAHALQAVPVRLLAYCIMPNHWHLLLCPPRAGQLAAFMARLTMTHTRRWQEHYHQVGHGHLYQGRFKSFPVQDDVHFLAVARYIERNPLRAQIVQQATDWRWSSLHRRRHPGEGAQIPLAPWPVERPPDWARRIQTPQNEKELAALRTSVDKGRPFGDATWQATTTRKLRLQSSYRDAGRPRKVKK